MAVYKGNKANQKGFKWTEYTRIHLSESLSTAVTSNHRNMQCHVTKSATPLKTRVLGVYTHRKVERFKNAPLSYSFTFIVVLSIRFALLV